MNKEQIGRTLRSIRERKRLTLREVGEAAGVSFQYVSDVEKAEANVTIGALERLAAATGAELIIEIRDVEQPDPLSPLWDVVKSLDPEGLALLIEIAQAIQNTTGEPVRRMIRGAIRGLTDGVAPKTPPLVVKVV